VWDMGREQFAQRVPSTKCTRTVGKPDSTHGLLCTELRCFSSLTACETWSEAITRSPAASTSIGIRLRLKVGKPESHDDGYACKEDISPPISPWSIAFRGDSKINQLQIRKPACFLSGIQMVACSLTCDCQDVCERRCK